MGISIDMDISLKLPKFMESVSVIWNSRELIAQTAHKIGIYALALLIINHNFIKFMSRC